MTFQLKLLCCVLCLLAVQELPGAAGDIVRNYYHPANVGTCSTICQNQLDETVQTIKAMLKEELKSVGLVGDSTPVRRPGDWITIQRRNSGAVNFYRGWDEYKKGFGSPSGEFWLGNDKIHQITSKGRYMLRIELEYRGRRAYADYDSFSIDSEKMKYKLHLGKYSGNAGDSLGSLNNMMFSTFDQDNDTHPTLSCARFCKGAWWYQRCQYSNLNGVWGSRRDQQAIDWFSLARRNGVTFSEMKIRQVFQ